MYDKFKSYLTIISIVIAVLTSIYGLYTKVLNDKLARDKANLQDELSVKTTETVTYQNKLGQTVTKVIEYELAISSLEHSKDSLEKKIYAAYKASDIKRKQINSATIVQLVSSNKLGYDSIVHIRDTVPCPKEIRYVNTDYIEAISYPDSLTYTIKEEIILLDAKRLIDRKFFLWRWVGWHKTVDRNMIEMVSNNPNSSLTGRKLKIKH